MAIHCKYCGTGLPKEDARFCNTCGMLVPSHPFSHQSLSAQKSNTTVSAADSSDEPPEKHRRVLREQVAELSPAHTKPEQSDPAKKLEVSAAVEDMPREKLPDTPQPTIEEDKVLANVEEAPELLSPSLASSRQAGVKRRMRGPAQASVSTSAWPAPVTHVSVAPVQRPDEQREMAPVSTGVNEEAEPVHETLDVPEDEEIHDLGDAEDIAIEDAPTRAVAVPVEDVPTQAMNTAKAEDRSMHATDVSVEDLPTRSVPVPPEKPSRVQERAVEQASPVPATPSVVQEQDVEDWRVRAQMASSAPVDALASQSPLSSPGYQPGGEADSVAATPPVRRSRRRWPVVVVVLLLVLVLGGVGALGAMTLLSQQSSNDAIVQTQVGFSDPQLGLSLLYPNGWQKQIDAGKSTVHFYASNHIGQVDIMVTASSGTVKQALQQQATKMGMSGTKAGAAQTFAGESWQQLQGTMQVSGANYTDMLIATTHGSQLFMIVQQAPQNNYADWEKEFFASLRDSFKFL